MTDAASIVIVPLKTPVCRQFAHYSLSLSLSLSRPSLVPSDSVSLGEFGKHLPATATDAPESQSTHPPPSDSGCGGGRSQGESEEKSGSSEAPPTATMQEFEVQLNGDIQSHRLPTVDILRPYTLPKGFLTD